MGQEGFTLIGVSGRARRILYVCGTVGVPDIDRCNALVRAGHLVRAYELDKSTEYVWDKDVSANFDITKLQQASISGLVADIIKSDLLIVYGYNKPAAAAIANVCALLGHKAVSIHDSKFNDYRRSIFGDLVKSVLLAPYRSFFAASQESKEYLIYLGAKKDIHLYYCAIDIDRIITNSTVTPEHAYQDRDFLMIGRFVPKKNYHTALSSYERYRRLGGNRNFTICGYGELEAELRDRVSRSPLMHGSVSFIRAATTKQIGEALSRAVALLIPSTEEQFGIVVTEALAAGVPVIASQVCGACDLFENGAGGFKVEPQNIDGITMFMQKLGGNEQFWLQQRDICRSSARRADISVFTKAVDAVLVN
jgi:glycosyltransferase involved in cell wall biosynthesis